jgi:hypothetical protein
MAFEVDDIDAAVAALRARGVVFESYDFPGLSTVDGIAEIAGNYPSKGRAERRAWFRDSEGVHRLSRPDRRLSDLPALVPARLRPRRRHQGLTYPPGTRGWK